MEAGNLLCLSLRQEYKDVCVCATFFRSEDIFAGPDIFKGVFEDENMILRLKLELGLG